MRHLKWCFLVVLPGCFGVDHYIQPVPVMVVTPPVQPEVVSKPLEGPPPIPSPFSDSKIVK